MWRDASGQEWSTAITVTTIRRVKDMADVLLTDAADTDLIDRLYSDVMLLADVLYAVCQPVAEERHVSSAQFGERLAGDVIDQACASFMADLVAFFPSGHREIVNRISQAASRLEAERVKLLETRLTEQQLTSLIQTAVERAGQEIDDKLAALGAGSGKSPEPSASTQAR